MEDQERLTLALSDRYAVEREVGSGGMATVYLAQDLKHNRRVAVKVLDPELAQALGAERFLREIETAANLTHPHILPLFDSGEADGFLFYVMPFVKGESLRSRLTREKQLPVEDAIQVTREIADALAYAHREGVIHRDVKPANIMLLELLKRRGRPREDEIRRLNLVEPFDLQGAKEEWLEALAATEAFVLERPPEELGCLYYSAAEDQVTLPEPGASLEVQGLVPHFGAPGGVIPQVVENGEGE